MTSSRTTFRTVVASMVLGTALITFTIPQATACPEIALDAQTGSALPQNDLNQALDELTQTVALASVQR